DLLAVHGDRTKRCLLAPHAVGQIIAIDRQEPAYVGPFALKRGSGPFSLSQMSFVAGSGSKHKAEHVKEMHADIGGNAAGLGLVSLPRRMVPPAARSYVSKLNLVALVAFRKTFTERDNRRMQSQL